MAVTVNSERKAVEIAWDTAAEPPEVDNPPIPTHPIYLPPYVDNAPPTDQPHPDQGLPEEQPHPDQGLPEEQPKPEHPIYLPPYIDNSLPEPQPHPDHELPEIPPDLGEGIPPEKLEAIKEFLLGNLPPFTGAPEYPAPVSTEDMAVQVFAQGQEGDWSNTAVMPNDGLAVLTYPEDFTGESYVEVRALDGTLVDSGTITVE